MVKPLIKLGILGAGSFVQRRILPCLPEVESVEVTCLHNRNQSKAEEITKRFNIPDAVASRDALIHNPNVDAIFIATPNHCHEEDVIACAAAQKPVLCEKPLAPTADAISRMQKVYNEAKTPLFVGHSLRFKPSVRKARTLLEKGTLGRLLHMRAYFTLPVPEENWRHQKSFSGGALQDIGVHLIDLIHFITGEKITSIRAIANKDFDSQSHESEKSVIAIGHLEKGATISFECSIDAPLRSGFEVIGTHSRLVSTNSLRQTDDPVESLSLIQEDDSVASLPLETVNIYAEELKHFAAVLRGEKSSLIDAEVGLQNQRVIDATYKSMNLPTTSSIESNRSSLL